ncbi:MAG TPA: hypothetical protein VMF90_05310 [Rhizobiaceae bacterium]|nr:hypothetical protein [Rhizobiaceae bacterium]
MQPWENLHHHPMTLDEFIGKGDDTVFRDDVIESLRFLRDGENAAARCPARLCRSTGRCHATCNADRKLICHAGNPDAAMLKRVERLANFISYCRS